MVSHPATKYSATTPAQWVCPWGELSLAGDANDRLYAGLLSGTNLGAPIASGFVDGHLGMGTQYKVLFGI